LTKPDAPTSLIEVYVDRKATELGITWEKGTNSGGSPVLDYTVSYDQAINEFVVLDSNIINKSYVAINLVPGLSYKFKV